jgi:hypothetical protein
MAKKKLSLASVVKAAGVGEMVEKTISFVGSDGEAYEGEVLIKRLSHHERTTAIDAWELDDNSKATVDQYTKATLHAAVYTTPTDKFFPHISDTGLVNFEIVNALLKAVDEVNDFTGKNWILNQKKNSGVNSSSTELVGEPSKTPNEK